MKTRLLGLVIGALIGAFSGTGTGVVIGGGGGMAGVWVFGILGAVVGVFAAPDVEKARNRLARIWDRAEKD